MAHSGLLTAKEVARQIGVSERTIMNWRLRVPRGMVKLRFIRLGQQVVKYRQQDVDEFLQANLSSARNADQPRPRRHAGTKRGAR